MLPKPCALPRLLHASVLLRASRQNPAYRALAAALSVGIAKSCLCESSVQLCAGFAVAPLCPGSCQVPRIWSPKDFWQEAFTALAREGQLAQEDAAKIKQSCV